MMDGESFESLEQMYQRRKNELSPSVPAPNKATMQRRDSKFRQAAHHSDQDVSDFSEDDYREFSETEYSQPATPVHAKQPSRSNAKGGTARSPEEKKYDVRSRTSKAASQLEKKDKEHDDGDDDDYDDENYGEANESGDSDLGIEKAKSSDSELKSAAHTHRPIARPPPTSTVTSSIQSEIMQRWFGNNNNNNSANNNIGGDGSSNSNNAGSSNNVFQSISANSPTPSIGSTPVPPTNENSHDMPPILSAGLHSVPIPDPKNPTSHPSNQDSQHHTEFNGIAFKNEEDSVVFQSPSFEAEATNQANKDEVWN